MPLQLVIPVLVFVALGGLFLYLLRRLGTLVEQSRDTDVFRRSVKDLAARVDATLGSVISQVDAVRRGQGDADTLTEPIDGALEALLGYGEEARALAGPPQTAAAKLAFVGELDRADRALQMVEHGVAVLTSAGRDPRHGEGQTAIKRGYLNALHAREAIARHAADIAAIRAPEELRWLSRRPTTPEPRPEPAPTRR